MVPSQKVTVGDNERQFPTYISWEFGGVIDAVSARQSELQARGIDMGSLRAKINADAKQFLAPICSGLVTLCS